jgi:mercuric reductase
MRRVRRVIDDGRRYYEQLLAHDPDALWVDSYAQFVDGRLRVAGDDADLRGVPVVIAVGARPVAPPVPVAADAVYLTSDEMLRLPRLPRSLAIVGGGSIAVEFAQSLARLGVAVTVVMRADAPLRSEEPPARELVARVLAADGVRIVTGAQSIEVHRGRVVFAGGEAVAEIVMVATGRQPNLERLAPTAGGIDLDGVGIAVDRYLATSVDGVWAVGDAVGGQHQRFQFTHAATYDGPQAAENALASARNQPRYDTMPRVTFTDPEVAGVGLTEAEARSGGHAVHVHTKLVREVGRARAVGETEGFVKVVLDRTNRRLLGATIVAAHAGDMLAELTMPLHQDQGALDSLLATTFAHPTLSEAVKVAVRGAVAEIAP